MSVSPTRRKKKKRKNLRYQPPSPMSLGILLAVTLAGIILPVAAGLGRGTAEPKPVQPTEVETPEVADPTPTPTVTPTPYPEGSIESDLLFSGRGMTTDPNSITLLATGDNICHTQLYEKAWLGDGYDFKPYYAGIKDFISSVDIATVNQESPMATALSGPSGFPRFNTPSAMGAALIDAGFDVINLGNNHIYDQGSEGAMLTKEYFDEHDTPSVGLYTNWDDIFDIRVIEKNGIKVAFVSFVEMTNHDPDGSQGDIVFLDDDTTVKKQLDAAKEVSDIIVAHVHWGEENTRELTDNQLERSQWLVDQGVDIIIGNHSHILQKMTVLTRSSDGQKCPVAFSLGNFFSNQDHPDQLISALWVLSVTKDPESGEVYPDRMGVVPLVTHYSDADRTDFALYPICEYSADMANSHYANFSPLKKDGEVMSLEYIKQVFDETIPARYINQLATLE